MDTKTRCFCLKVMCLHKTKCFVSILSCVYTKQSVFVSNLLCVDTIVFLSQYYMCRHKTCFCLNFIMRGHKKVFLSQFYYAWTQNKVLLSQFYYVFTYKCFCLNMWTQKCFFKFIINYFGSTLYIHFLCPQLIIDPKYEQLNKIIWKF